MYKIIIALTLMSYTSSLYAYKQQIITSEQIKQDLKLVQSIAQAKKNSGGIITVGGDPNGCDFNNIQDAIDSIPFSGSGLIHIATNKIYNENLIIGDANVTIIGGYQDCTAAGSPLIQPGNEKISIVGNDAALPALRIGGSLLRSTIILKNMTLTLGSSTSSLLGAGLTAFDADAQVLLENISIRNNSGSGLAVLGSVSGTTNTDIVMFETVISSNTASLVGGGIYCTGDDASIVMGSDSGLIFNQVSASNGRGGGAFISAGCSFSMYSAEMNDNSAQDGGGGLFAGNGAQINLIGRQVCDGKDCLGDNIRPIRFNDNHGDADSSGQGNGGAMYITGASTFVNMSQVWIDDNTAHHGGAISVHDSAQVYIQRFSRTCWNSHIDDKCNLLESNLVSTSNGRGGAIYNEDGVVLINQAYLENNRADIGTAIYTTGASAVTIIDGSVFNHNGNSGTTYQDQYVINASGGAEYLIIHSTFADNNAINAVLNVGLGSQLTMRNSIIHDINSDDVMNANNPGTTEFECLIVHENKSIDGFSIYIDDPEFIDRDNGDYHINAAISPAVDLCTTITGTGDDIDTDLRGWDDLTVTNQDNNPDAIYDAGADETYDNDIIFKNGFSNTSQPL